MTWTAEHHVPGPRDTRVTRIFAEGQPLSTGEACRLWRESEAFRDFTTGLLVASPFSAFRWETPPVTRDSLGRPFEFAVLGASWLDTAPDPSPFAEHFRSARAGETVITFANLGGDAVMVVPCPIGPEAAYGHFAAFLRGAPGGQIRALWKAVGEAMEARVGIRPVWLSTAGGGVAWLHVRLDSRPKYYGYDPFRNAPSS